LLLRPLRKSTWPKVTCSTKRLGDTVVLSMSPEVSVGVQFTFEVKSRSTS
jgi:hypothetical protein